MLLDLRSLWEGPLAAKIKITPGRLIRPFRKIYRDPAATDGVLVADAALESDVRQHRVFRWGELVADAGLSTDIHVRRAVVGELVARGAILAEVRVRRRVDGQLRMKNVRTLMILDDL